MQEHRPEPPAASLEEKIAFLRRPEAYADRPAAVDVRETHMSWVFLTDRFAYKLKKPVRYSFLDFSSLEARAFFCGEEVRLNRRLAPEVYLGALPLCRAAGGALNLSGAGQVVEWLVHMVRLPADTMMDRRIAAGRLTTEDVARLGETLARFYAGLPPEAIAAGAYIDRLSRAIEENASGPLQANGATFAKAAREVAERQLGHLERRRPQFTARLDHGRIVEGHGDLRPEHVCLDGVPRIIDCLEFNRDFRVLDPAEELAFLAIECELLGADWVGDALFETYARVRGDEIPPDLVVFFKTYRACLRARLCAWHADEPGALGAKGWLQRAHAYLALAARYAAQL
jgi:aminoglycoside phosphotransferase family enzyme